MSAHRVLLIEDDEDTASFILDTLAREGFTLEHFSDGLDGRKRLDQAKFDVIILDRMLPGMNGMSLLQDLRASGDETPVIFLTSLGDVFQRVDGLTAGSNDYLVKPFDIHELLARIKILLRYERSDKSRNTITKIEGIELNLLTRTVHYNEKIVELKPREFRLLSYLMKNANQTVTRSMLLEGVWEYHFDPGTNVIDVHISGLRKKLDDLCGKPMLHTVRGVGYRFGEPVCESNGENS